MFLFLDGIHYEEQNNGQVRPTDYPAGMYNLHLKHILIT